MSITEQYATFCSNLSFDDLPEEVVERTKHLTLDTLGATVGSVRVESTDVILRGVSRRNGDRDGATVLGTGEPMAPEYAALVNGAMAHSIEYDDIHQAGSVHPGAPVIPTALAAGEEVDADGKTLLTAIVAGYEITTRLAMAVNPASHYDRGFHMTSTCGLFGATAAAGIVYGFDEAEFVSAFGLNGSQAAGSLQFLENGGWNKRAHPGLVGHNALLNTSFAQEGFVAADEPIEGTRGFLQGYSDDPDPGKATAGLGETYEILNTGVKPYPCCRYMHGPLDVLLELATEHDIAHDDVTKVTIYISSSGVKLVGNPTNAYPRSLVDCQFSLPFGTALALVYRDAGIDTFLEGYDDGDVSEELRRIIDRTTVTSTEWIEAAYPERWPVEVTIETTTETYTGSIEYPKGEPENPLSWDELVEKYTRLTEPILGETYATEAREAITDLDTIQVSELVAPFVAAGAETSNAAD